MVSGWDRYSDAVSYTWLPVVSCCLMRKESFPLCGLAEIDWSRKWVRVIGVGWGGMGGF